MRCPACNAEVEDGADLCLECGEPMGDGPAAKIARAESTAPAPQSVTSTVRGKRSAILRKHDDEREAIRCPGCGSPSKAARCPGCGIPLRAEVDD